MSDKNFGVKQINIIGGSGTPTLSSPSVLNLNSPTVAISTNLSIGGTITVQGDISVSGISTFTGSTVVGIDTSTGVVLTSPNGTQYQLFVEDNGTLGTVAV